MNEYKNVYIHIPKNAGTFIKEFMINIDDNDQYDGCKKERERVGDCSHYHKTYKEYIEEDINNKYNRYFTIIRDPYTRFESIYYYDKEFLKKLKLYPDYIYESFECFLDYFYNNRDEINKHKHLIEQSKYCSINNKLVDDIDILDFNELPINCKKYLEKINNPYHIHKLYDKFNTNSYNSHIWTDKEKDKLKYIYQNDFILLKKLFI